MSERARGNPKVGGPSGSEVYLRFLLIYGIIWSAVWIGFVSLSFPLFKRFEEGQLERRLRADAALTEEYISAVGAFSGTYRPVLEQVCKRLGEPSLLDAHVTFFSTKAEAIADSRFENPLAIRSLKRPEVLSALHKQVATSIRYSQMDRRKMAFVAYPHIHLGEVKSVIRIGVPYESLESPLWRLYFKIAFAGFVLALIAASLSTLYWHFRDVPTPSFEE